VTDRESDPIEDRGTDRADERRALGIGLDGGFREDDGLFARRIVMKFRERNGPAGLDAGNSVADRFDVGRIVILPVNDQHLFDAPAHVEFAFVEEPDVAGAIPVVFEIVRRRNPTAVVAVEHERAAYLNLADARAIGAPDAHLETR